MKITFVLPGVSIGGGVRVIYEYSNRFHKRGHEVNIVYPLIPSHLGPMLSIKDLVSQLIVTAYNLSGKNKPNWNLDAKLIDIITINSKYIAYIENSIPDADIIIATSWETAYLVNKLSENKGQKYYFVQSYEIWDVWENETCWEEVEQIEKDYKKWTFAMSFIKPDNKYLMRSKELVDNTYMMQNLKKITIASWLKGLLEDRFHQNVYGIVTNGVNFKDFYCENIPNKWHGPQEKITILGSVRGGSLLKGDFDLIKCLKTVKQKHPEVKIILFGSKGSLEIPEWVQFVDKPVGDKLRRLYCSAQIFVNSSRLEGCQLPPMEAMACGCAVVATNVGGIPDYAVDGVTVMCAPSKNPATLSQKIIQLIEDNELRKEIAKNGYNYIQKFSWDNATEEMERILMDNSKVL